MFISGLLIALARGWKAYDQWEPEEPLKSLVLTAEDDESQVINRYQNISRAMGITEDDVALMNIHVYPLDGHEVRLTRQEGRKVQINDDNFQWFRSRIEEHRPDIVILDTLSQFLGGDENVNDIMTETCVLLGGIIKEFKCNIILIHHTNKGAGDVINDKKRLKETLSQGSLRGASAFAGYLRWVAMLAPLSTGLARSLLNDKSLEAEDGQYVAVKVVKKNMGANEPPFFLKKEADEMGLSRVYPVKDEEQDSEDLQNNVNFLAGEVARVTSSGGSMTISNFYGPMSWGRQKAMRILDKAMADGLVEVYKKNRVSYLKIAGECLD